MKIDGGEAGMFLHIGGDVEVRICDLVGIFNIDVLTYSKNNKCFMQAIEQKRNICNCSTERPKSMVITEEKGKNHIYISPISSVTLQKRIGYIKQRSV